MKLLLAAALVALSAPAMAQGWTATPFGASIYGGQPQGYAFQPHNYVPDRVPVVPHGYTPPPHQTTCYTFGNQTVCN
jgi:hypothetical protein